MRSVRAWMVGAAIAALAFTTGVVAQQITSLTLSGNEAIVAAQGGPGGSSIFVTTAQLRNTTGVTLSTLAAPLTLTPLTADLCITAQPASAANITLPATPFDGEIFEVINCTTSAFATNVFSVAPNTGQTLLGGNIALTTLAAGASKELRYVLSTTTWYPMR